MEQEIIKLLDQDLECIRYKLKNQQVIFEVKSSREKVPCPYCGKVSSKIHSVYQREIQDKQTIILLNTRKMFCLNPDCGHKTFSERFDFIAPRERKTKRLVDKILLTSAKASSVSASALLKESSIKVCKSSICDLLKKMPSIVDKSSVTKICVDDFAIRKRKSYGTVMVNLITHRIIDLLPSRDSKDVKQWLSTFPDIELVARDGAVIYSSAISKSHPNAVQVSDRFHLIKGLAEAVNRIIIRLYPACLEIPNIQRKVPKEVEVLYNTANRSQRIRFAQKKRAEGLTIEEIALLLHSTTQTVQRYLAIPESEIPKNKPNTYERQHQLSVRKKQNEIDEAKELYSQGYPITKIAMMMHHTVPTIKRYLTLENSTINGHYGAKLGGKLAPFHDDIIELRSKGIAYPEIQKILSKKGYTGSVVSIRVFMQKERSHHYSKTGYPQINVTYVQRKSLCKLIYQKIENVPTLTQEQFSMTVERYPLLGTLYSLIKEFYEVIYSKQSKKLDSWIEHAKMVNQPELNTFLEGINKDLTAVKNGITEQYNNGLAEGSVNKIKVIKRIMYGRNNFELLKAKVFFGEYFRYVFN